MQKLALEKFSDIINDLKFLISKEKFPILRKENEREIDHFYFKWTPVSKTPGLGIKKNFIFPSLVSKENQDRNFNCKFCPKKLSAIRGFLHKGKLPILVLHYTGETRKGGRAFIKKQGQIFRTAESENLFERMINKVFQVSMKDLYYQEFPGCIFNQDNSMESDWNFRIEACENHIVQTIIENNIKGIIITGSAAVLYYGIEKAKELTGQIQMKKFGEKEFPFVVLRSPEGIISLEKKKKKFESNKNSKEYLKAQEEETIVKKEIVNYMEVFKTRIDL